MSCYLKDQEMRAKNTDSIFIFQSAKSAQLNQAIKTLWETIGDHSFLTAILTFQWRRVLHHCLFFAEVRKASTSRCFPRSTATGARLLGRFDLIWIERCGFPCRRWNCCVISWKAHSAACTYVKFTQVTAARTFPRTATARNTKQQIGVIHEFVKEERERARERNYKVA